MRKIRFRTPLFSLSATLALACAAQAPGPEEAIRETVQAMLAAVEEKDPGGVLEPVSFEYRGEEGLGYADVQSLVLTFLLWEEPIGVRLQSLSIESLGASGQQRVQARVAFARGVRLRQSPRPLPLGSVEYSFDLVFAPDGAAWKAVRGTYRRL